MQDPDIVMFIAKALGTCIAICIVSFFLIGVFLGDKLEIEPLNISDKFEIGYIENKSPQKTEDQESKEIRALKYKLARLKLEKQIKRLEEAGKTEREQSSESSNGFVVSLQDCINALVKLGENKSSAAKIATDYLNNNPDTSTVEQFVAGVYQKSK